MSSAGFVQGTSNAAQIWNFLANKGLSATAISGILGNLQQESSFDPNATNPSSGAYGIAQWLGSRYSNLQSYCQQNGYSWSTLQGQVNFLWYEMSGGDSQWFSALQGIGGMGAFNSLSVSQATQFFEEYYEVAGAGALMGTRLTYADNWYSTYTGGNPFNTGSSRAGSNYPSAPSNQNGINNQIVFPPTNYSVVANSQRTGDILYGRRYRVVVSDKNGVALDVSDLHCTFNIQYVINKTPPFSTVEIYNLNPQTENAIMNYGARVVVEAGYEGNQYGVIFDGELIEAIRDRPDSVSDRLTLYALTGEGQANTAFVNFTVARGQSQRSIVQNIASKATVPAPLGEISPQLSGIQLPRGKAVFGKASDYIRQIAQSNNMAPYYTAGGVLNLMHASDPPKGTIVDLTPQTGLINSPAQNGIGVSFDCLLNPAITIGTMVHIDSLYIQAQAFQPLQGQVQRPLDSQGIYRVTGVTHSGDTRGSSWTTSCTSVSQMGSLPAMLTTASRNPYGG